MIASRVMQEVIDQSQGAQKEISEFRLLRFRNIFIFVKQRRAFCHCIEAWAYLGNDLRHLKAHQFSQRAFPELTICRRD
jgi:hypothetical protein